MIVSLTVNEHYLKRIKEIAPNANDGVTSAELSAASKSAEDDVLTALHKEGWDTTVWTSDTNTPNSVIETIRLLGAAKVWNRILMTYDRRKNFQDTYGHALLVMANDRLNTIIQNKLLRKQDGTMTAPTLGEQERGLPAMTTKKTNLTVNPQIAPDADIACVIKRYGPGPAQDNPFDLI